MAESHLHCPLSLADVQSLVKPNIDQDAWPTGQKSLTSAQLIAFRRALNANVVPQKRQVDKQRSYLELYRNPNHLPAGADVVLRENLPNLS